MRRALGVSEARLQEFFSVTDGKNNSLYDTLYRRIPYKCDPVFRHPPHHLTVRHTPACKCVMKYLAYLVICILLCVFVRLNTGYSSSIERSHGRVLVFVLRYAHGTRSYGVYRNSSCHSGESLIQAASWSVRSTGQGRSKPVLKHRRQLEPEARIVLVRRYTIAVPYYQ